MSDVLRKSGEAASDGSRRLRVLQFVNTLDVGGGTDYALTLCEQIDADKFDCWIAAGPGKTLLDRARACAVDVLELDSMKPSHTRHSDNTLVGDLKSFVALYRFLRANEIDVIHSHGSKSRLMGGLAATLARVPVRVQSAHGFAFNARMGPAKHFLFRQLERLMGILNHVLVVESQHDFRLAQQLRLSSDVRYVSTGLDFTRLAAVRTRDVVRESLGIARDAVVITMAGRLAYQKDPITFVRAAEQVARTRESAVFVLVGDGDLAEEVRASVGDHPSIKLLGYRADVQDVIAASDAFVLCSRWEGIPLTALAAQYHGLPLVLSDTLGLPELVVSESAGLLVQPGDVAGFSRAIEKLVDDPELRARMGRAGHNRLVAEHDMRTMVSEFQSLFAQERSPEESPLPAALGE